MNAIQENTRYEMVDVFPDKRKEVLSLMSKYNIADIHYVLLTDDDKVYTPTLHPYKGKYLELYLNKDYDEKTLESIAEELATVVMCKLERTSFPAITTSGKVVFFLQENKPVEGWPSRKGVVLCNRNKSLN